MKLFSAYIEGQIGPEKIVRAPFVIAADKIEARAKLDDHIKTSPRLRQMRIKSLVLVEESAIF